MNVAKLIRRSVKVFCLLVVWALCAVSLRVKNRRLQHFAKRTFNEVLSHVTIFPMQAPRNAVFYEADATLNPYDVSDFSVTIQAKPVARADGNVNVSVGDFDGLRVRGFWEDRLQETGWNYLRVEFAESNAENDDPIKAYLAGVLEGYLTAHRIQEFYSNTRDLHNATPAADRLEKLRKVLAASVAYIRRVAHWNPGQSFTSYILQNTTLPAVERQLLLSLLQIWGITDGYATTRRELNVTWPKISLLDMMLLSADGDYLDLKDAVLDDLSVKTLQVSQPAQPALQRRHFSRCSALIRLTPQASDLFVGHTTWEPYSEMTRIIKYYVLPYRGVVAKALAMTSYPGAITSTDDFILTSSSLAVLETSIDVKNRQLLRNRSVVHLEDRAPDFMGPLLATRLASSGKHWAATLGANAVHFHNVASYHWMVADYSKFTPGIIPTAHDEVLFVVETAPGMFRAEDMSETLSRKGFWSSANVATFPEVRRLVGETNSTNYHREFMFSQGAPYVSRLESMQKLMQFSAVITTQTHPKNEVEFLIAPRFDLHEKHRTPEGATDSKITNNRMMRQLEFVAISGPQHEYDSPFNWNTEPFNSWPHRGLPDRWNFSWQHITPTGIKCSEQPSVKFSTSDEGTTLEHILLHAAMDETHRQLGGLSERFRELGNHRKNRLAAA